MYPVYHILGRVGWGGAADPDLYLESTSEQEYSEGPNWGETDTLKKHSAGCLTPAHFDCHALPRFTGPMDQVLPWRPLPPDFDNQ